jgi:predicted ribosome quality control (RQC) complex YloA/Tae2 family protein
VTLTGFHGEPVEISLDPTLSPQENADALYREAARLERIRERLPDLLAETEERIRELEELRRSFEEGRVDPEEVDRKVPDLARKGSGGSPEGEERLPFQRYRSSGGLEIRVGRGPRDNDDLTFRHSDPEDIWLHARQASGAHVILRWSREGNPPRNDLAEAATLAALNSQARNAGTVPVDWTRRKYVRKPRKASPGAVVPDRVQTVFVRPDPELPQRLGREDY